MDPWILTAVIAPWLLAVGMLIFDIYLWTKTQKNIIDGQEKTAIRARGLILNDPMFSDTKAKLERIEGQIANIKFPVMPSIPPIPTVNEISAAIPRFDMETVRSLVRSEVSAIRIPTVPSAVEIAASLGQSPQVVMTIKDSMKEAVAAYFKTDKTGTPLIQVEPEEVQQAIFNQYYDMLSPFIGEQEADRMANGIAKAPPVFREDLIAAARKKIKKWGMT